MTKVILCDVCVCVVMQDPFFKREGNDVLEDLPISISQAMLGSVVTLPTLTGEVELKIPRGTQPDTVLKLRNKGVKQMNSRQQGSQLVTLKVQIPKTLTPTQTELMEAFAKEEGVVPCKAQSFAETIKKTIQRIATLLQADKNKSSST